MSIGRKSSLWIAIDENAAIKLEQIERFKIRDSSINKNFGAIALLLALGVTGIPLY